MFRPRSEIKQAWLAFATVALAITAFVRIDVDVPFIGHLGSALVAVVLLYAPVYFAWRQGKDIADYGFVIHPRGRGLAFGLGVPALVFPLFLFVYVLFYNSVCTPESTFSQLAPAGLCRRWDGWDGFHLSGFDWELANFALIQLVVVALPEELFFRGYLHELFERAFPPKRRFLGGGIGLALVLSSLCFALIHIPKDGDLRSLATFFPGLMFGWMRSATGSILASTIAHASSNVFIRVLDQMFLR